MPQLKPEFKMSRRFIAALLLATGAVTSASANQLRTETLQAWNSYIDKTNSELSQRFNGQRSFLAMDERPDIARLVRQGQAVAFPVDGSPQKVPHGLIHDWIGDVFVRDAKLDDVMAVLADYGRYKEFYKPMIGDSKVLARDGDHEKVNLVMADKVFTVICRDRHRQ